MPPHNLASIAPPRTLAHVLLDIAENERANATSSRLFYAAYANGDDNEADCQSDIGAAIDDQLSALRDEARMMIEDATGISWKQIEGANL